MCIRDRPVFSLDVEVTLITPGIPFRFSSILRITPSSISSGDAPGYVAFIEINLESISGKNDDFNEIIPAIPKTTKNSIKIFTAFG